MYILFCSDSGHDASAVEYERSTIGALKEGLCERVGGSRVLGLTNRCRDNCVPAQPATESKLHGRGWHALLSLTPPLHALLFAAGILARSYTPVGRGACAVRPLRLLCRDADGGN